MIKKGRELIITVLPVVLFLLMIFLEPFYTLDHFICDITYQRQDGINPQIKIIAIDEKCLDEYGKFENWSRKKTALLIDRLYANPEMAPSILGIDILFSGEQSDLGDENLKSACEKADFIVMASNIVYKGETKKSEDGKVFHDIWNVELMEKPFAELNELVYSGFTDAYMGKDGTVRYTKLKEECDGNQEFNFAWLIYEKLEEQKGVKAKMPKMTNDGKLNFFYSGEAGEFPHFSLKDVLDGKIPMEEFRDSVVLLGTYAPGFQDAYYTSAERGTMMYGVEIQANILQALIDGKTAVPLSRILYALVAAVILLWFFLFGKKHKLSTTVTMGILIGIVHLLLGRVISLFGFTIPQAYFLIVILAGLIYFIIEKYVIEKIKKRKLLSTFKTYVAPQVVDTLAKDDEFQTRLGGEKRPVAVLFVDIRGFTPLSESLKPEEVVQVLNEYLALTTSCILKNEGMLDKFIGDATMAIFNAPVDLDDYVYKAVCTALDMKAGADEMAKKIMEKSGKSVSFGIGINCGEAVIGNIGCEFRMDYTAIGDTVNTAARLESRAAKGEILVSEAVYEAVKDRVEAELVGPMELKGKAKAVNCYRVLNKK